MKKKIFFLIGLALAFLPATLFSQAHYKAGYIITAQGDSVRGEVDDQEWDKSPRKINFRQGGAGSAYDIAQLNAFGIDGGDQYIKKTVSRTTRPTDVNNLFSNYDDSIITEPLLLRRVVDGRWTLYYAYIEKPLFFMQMDGGNIEELRYALLRQGNSYEVTTSYAFRDQLQARRMADGADANMPATLRTLPYSERDLRKFFLQQNGMKEETKKGPAFVVGFYAGAGISFNSLKMGGNFAQLSNNPAMSSTLSPVIQAGIDLGAARIQQRLVVRAELAAFQFASTHHGTVAKTATVTAKNNLYELKMMNIQPSLSILYHFLVYEKLRVYAGVGYAHTFSSYNKNRAVVEEPDWDRSTVYDPYLVFEKSWGALYGRLGVIVHKRIEAGLRYNFQGSFSRYITYDIAPHSLMMQLSYRF